VNLDANASAPTTELVVAAVVKAMRSGAANPSSGHALGDRARVLIERARDEVTSLVAGALEDGVVFTSGCTEANNTVLRGVPAGGTIVTTAVEHSSILRPLDACRAAGVNVSILPVNCDGAIELTGLEGLLDSFDGPVLVSVQAANSETGVIQPLIDIARIVALRPDAWFHSDAAQAFGRTTLRTGRPHGPDLLTISGHKVHGPMGVGAIIIGPDAPALRPLLLGGGQESGMRAGTQAVPTIVGFAAACQARAARFDADLRHMLGLRNRLEGMLAEACPSMVVNGGRSERLPNTSNVRFPGVDGMALVANLDAMGIMCSQGSACTSGRPEPSHVLMAMGLTEADAFSSIRLSVSPCNTIGEIDRAVTAIASSVAALQGTA
jgi:cysteine desulfurase